MPSDLRVLLGDIEAHIRLARQFVSGMDLPTFQGDLRTVFAVIRCLEVISEASRRLPDDLKARHPSIPWKNIAGAGNVFRHDYEEVASSILWNTVQDALPRVEEVIRWEIGRLDSAGNDKADEK